MKKIRAVVSGTIQNVGYRAKVIGFARVFDLTGFVYNLDGGQVRIIAEGEENNLDAFVGAIQIANTLIKVDDVEVEYADVTGDLNDFYKLVGSGETDERLDTAAEYLKKLISVTENGFGSLDSKMGVMIEKQDVMIEKQDVMIEKQDVMIEKQDVMIEKQDVMIEKQDETLDEIRGLRVDMKSYMDRKFGEIEEDLFMIKSVLKTSGMLN